MEKRVKKSKLKGGVTAMELLELPQSSSSSPSGVKTRARTLALQKIENPTPRRSPRLLNKPNPQINSPNPRRPNSRSRLGVSCSAVIEQKEDKEEESVVQSFEVTSCGENVFGTQLGNGSTRETTPCSLIRGSDTVGTPGSTTRVMRSSATSRRRQNTARSIPAHEIDEFFTCAEQEQQRIFTEKYNFDLVNESPLPGRYEWERV